MAMTDQGARFTLTNRSLRTSSQVEQGEKENSASEVSREWPGEKRDVYFSPQAKLDSVTRRIFFCPAPLESLFTGLSYIHIVTLIAFC